MAGLADTTAAPAILTVGWLFWRRDLLLAPLTMRDLGWYERAAGGAPGAITGEQAVILIWLSLRREQPWITLARCRRMLRLHPRAFLRAYREMLPALNPGTFREASGEPEAGGPVVESNWHHTILRAFATLHNWPVEIVLDLTPLQIDIYLEGERAKSSGDRVEFDSLAEARAYQEMKREEREERNGV